MSRLAIAGAGGFGRGLFGWVLSSPSFLETWGIEETVFIDDSEPKRELPAPVVSTIREFQPQEGDVVLVAVADPRARSEIVESLTLKGCRFATFVDDRAVVNYGVRLGEGAVVCPGANIDTGAALGVHVHVNVNGCVGHDTVIGDFSTLSPGINIMGEVAVGREVFFGGSAAVLPRLSVGSLATVGAGALVRRPVGEEQTVVGNPARPLDARGQRR